MRHDTTRLAFIAMALSALAGLSAMSLLPTTTARAAALPSDQYSQPFPHDIDKLEDRRWRVILHSACSSDRQLLEDLRTIGRDDDHHESALNVLLAKSYFYLHQDEYFRHRSAEDPESDPVERGGDEMVACPFYTRPKNDFHENPEDDTPPDIRALRDQWLIAHTQIAGCDNHSLSFGCLRWQINDYLMRVKRGRTIGSTGLLCSSPATVLSGTSTGEWNVGLRPLMRLAVEAHNAETRSGHILIDDATWEKMWMELFSLAGPPQGKTYSVTDCANQEDATGMPQDRVDDDAYHSSLPDKIGNALKELLKWLFRHVLRSQLFAAGIGAVFGPAAGAAAGAFMSAAAAAEDMAQALWIPETENHLLQIDVARYLTNQLIMERVDDSTGNGVGRFREYQDQLRDRLLKDLNEIARKDFVEYNSRPYQRYSIPAIQNLYDLANRPPVRGEVTPDTELRNAARAVLELASAKFAIGSLQHRRYVPLRRKMEQVLGALGDHDRPMPAIIEFPGSEPHGTTGLFDLGPGMDHQIAAFVYYNGPSAQSPRLGYVTWDAMRTMLPAAVSGYLPTDLVRSIAASITVRHEQTLNHHGRERFVRGPGYLLSAGGTMTGYAYQAELGWTIALPGLPLPPVGPSIPIQGKADDLGVALPSTLMLSPTVHRSTLEQHIHFKGNPRWFGDRMLSYDNNLCVKSSFACGYNLTIPDDYPMHTVSSGYGTWLFVDTSLLPIPYIREPPDERVFIAMFRAETSSAPARALGIDNVGVLEVADAGRFGTTDPFSEFRNNVLTRNRERSRTWLAPDSLIDKPNFKGIYTLMDGTAIEFDTRLTENSATNAPRMRGGSGIVTVNGVPEPAADDWPRASGPLSETDNGLFRLDGKTVPTFCFDELVIGVQDHENPYVTGGSPCAH